MSGRFKFIFIITLILTIGFPSAVFSARVKDISSVQGIRQNQLFGYGLVVGLDGSGDNAGKGFTIQSLVNLLERMGINVNRDDVRSKNVAAVMVNATLPPFARIGKKIVSVRVVMRAEGSKKITQRWEVSPAGRRLKGRFPCLLQAKRNST